MMPNLDRLDDLLGEAGIDTLLVTSKHNIQYLLAGHRHHFFDYMDAIGVSRYLPVLAYQPGRAEHAAYVANRNEKDALRNAALDWPATILFEASTSLEAIGVAIGHLRRVGAPCKRIGIEAGFLPSDAADMLRSAFPEATLVEAHRPLERLRAVKTTAELALLRRASEQVAAAMQAVFANYGAGATKRQLGEALRREETQRGLTFEYALIAVGASHNRAPSDQAWRAGEVLSIDSGGNCQGYIGDLCRMAVLGTPDAELEDLLAEVDAIQQAARGVIRAGQLGGAIHAAGEAALAASAFAGQLRFVAHGMGLVSHEAPRLTATGPVPYPASDAELPLQAGMVLSVETTLLHPTRGFIKLEDTLAVTADGAEALGDAGRGWNVGGSLVARNDARRAIL